MEKDKLLSQFLVIRDNILINEVNDTLGKTPLRYYTEFLEKHVYQSIRYNRDGEDYLGRFYGEFMSYSGGDGQSLGIILMPKHITNLFCDLLDLKPNDRIFDPCGSRVIIMITANRSDGIRDRTPYRKMEKYIDMLLRAIFDRRLPYTAHQCWRVHEEK